MQYNRPLLSIGMIVKNEMRCLKRCLEALAPLREALPCQLVIADTGSTDGTRELAAEYADIIFDFEWCDDFAAARNAVLDRCTGVWHLQVDADEYLDGNFSELVQFLQSKRAGEFQQGVLMVRNYRFVEMTDEDYVDFHARRLLRIDTGARYTGAIHESLPIMENYNIVQLDNVVFHHDGYAINLNKDKGKRNLPLLERELDNNPGDLRLTVLCLEGSRSVDNIRKYAVMAIGAAEAADKNDPDLYYWRIAAYHDAVMLTAGLMFSEAAIWAERSKELFPDSILIGVGVSYAYALYLARMGNYEAACAQLNAYFKARARFNAGDYDAVEFQIVSPSALQKSFYQTARVTHLLCLSKLERWRELAEALDILDLSGRQTKELHINYLSGVIQLWNIYHPDAELLLRRIVDSLADRGNPDSYDGFMKICLTVFAEHEDKNEDDLPSREIWDLFATLGDGCDLGRFGLIMAAEDAAMASELLAKVERLDLLPPAALQHALSLGAALPEGFFRQNAEQLSAHAAGLAKLLKDKPNTAAALCGNAGGDPGKALFGYILATELAGNLDWEKQGGMALMDYYCDRAEEYLDTFYNPAMLATESLYALPMLARFAAHCAQARKARRAGDELGYVRQLKAGLETCPGMKNMVAWLVERAKAKAAGPKATPELMALAEQIRAILAQYPADDPAVLALKASGEYKLVAHLIEEEQ